MRALTIFHEALSLAAVLLYPDRLAVHLMPSMIFDFNHGNLLNAAWLPPHNAEGQHSLRSWRRTSCAAMVNNINNYIAGASQNHYLLCRTLFALTMIPRLASCATYRVPVEGLS
ncbi:hypothetical protein C8Q69DRAFT_311651 [Paecilomyces variotii]|uniref:Uncharacterized protein n=1 Tax=Byssochlamys spectabilis TaxID=264951 RepID=A0A443HQ62_BYSSP|nr:hypothetical protein C8Q69DRAFT_311651 [Paecilomyces variotii]RWQ93978.1 hypothetical protein C8Q69DRAFT_311651 [Paecilomyces variotii]